MIMKIALLWDVAPCGGMLRHNVPDDDILYNRHVTSVLFLPKSTKLIVSVGHCNPVCTHLLHLCLIVRRMEERGGECVHWKWLATLTFQSQFLWEISFGIWYITGLEILPTFRKWVVKLPEFFGPACAFKRLYVCSNVVSILKKVKLSLQQIVKSIVCFLWGTNIIYV
jgi:hypothetical protein